MGGTHHGGRGKCNVAYGGLELVHGGGAAQNVLGLQGLDLDVEFLVRLLLLLRLARGVEVLSFGRYSSVKEFFLFLRVPRVAGEWESQ